MIKFLQTMVKSGHSIVRALTDHGKKLTDYGKEWIA